MFKTSNNPLHSTESNHISFLTSDKYVISLKVQILQLSTTLQEHQFNSTTERLEISSEILKKIEEYCELHNYNLPKFSKSVTSKKRSDYMDPKSLSFFEEYDLTTIKPLLEGSQYLRIDPLTDLCRIILLTELYANDQAGIELVKNKLGFMEDLTLNGDFLAENGKDDVGPFSICCTKRKKIPFIGDKYILMNMIAPFNEDLIWFVLETGEWYLVDWTKEPIQALMSGKFEQAQVGELTCPRQLTSEEIVFINGNTISLDTINLKTQEVKSICSVQHKVEDSDDLLPFCITQSFLSVLYKSRTICVQEIKTSKAVISAVSLQTKTLISIEVEIPDNPMEFRMEKLNEENLVAVYNCAQRNEILLWDVLQNAIKKITLNIPLKNPVAHFAILEDCYIFTNNDNDVPELLIWKDQQVLQQSSLESNEKAELLNFQTIDSDVVLALQTGESGLQLTLHRLEALPTLQSKLNISIFRDMQLFYKGGRPYLLIYESYPETAFVVFKLISKKALYKLLCEKWSLGDLCGDPSQIQKVYELL